MSALENWKLGKKAKNWDDHALEQKIVIEDNYPRLSESFIGMILANNI